MGAVLSWKNWAEQLGASLEVSSFQGALGARGMLTTQVQDIWRSSTWNSSTSAIINLDLGASRTIKLIAFAAPRDGVLPPSGATVAIRASNLVAGGTDALNLSAAAFTLNPWGVWGWRSNAGITARYIRLTFVGTGSSGLTYIQLGRLWVGDALITQYSYGYGQTRTFRDPGISSRAALTGVRYVSAGLSYRVERTSFPFLTQTEADTVVTAAGEVGTTKQIFFAKEEEFLGDGIFGHFSEVPAVNRQLEDLWTTDFTIEEDA